LAFFDEHCSLKFHQMVYYGAPEAAKVCIKIQKICIWNTVNLY